jgi:hypothetical protein
MFLQISTIYEIMWKNMAELDVPQLTDSVARQITEQQYRQTDTLNV